MRSGELTVRLKQAKGIRGDEMFGFGKADMYANLMLGSEKRKTKVLSDCGSEPVWNEQFRFVVEGSEKHAVYHTLRIFLFDKDLGIFLRDSARGQAKIDLRSVLEDYDNEIPLRGYPVIYKGVQKGTVELSVSFNPSIHQSTESGGPGTPADDSISKERGQVGEEEYSSVKRFLQKVHDFGRRRP